MSAGLILRDVVATILLKGPDDGAPTTVGSAITVCLDQVKVNLSRDTVDTSCNQDADRYNRWTKKDFTIDVETKLTLGGTLLESLASDDGVVVAITLTADGANISGTGLIKDLSVTLADPSTLTFQLIPYGAGLTIEA